MNKIKLNELVQFTPKATVSKTWITDIKKYLKANCGFSVPNDFDWQSPTMLKDLVEAAKKKEVLIGAGVMGAVGGTLGANTLAEVPYFFKISDELPWKAGDFGDYGSCFFTDDGKSFKTLKLNKTWAIKFYADERGAEGIGRAFVFVQEDGLILVFNAYGKMYAKDGMAKSVSSTASRQDNKITLVGALLAQYLEKSYKGVSLKMSSPDFAIFINGEKGVAIASEEELKYANSVEVELEEVPYSKCRKCGDVRDPEDLIDIKEAERKYYGGYMKLCNDCKRQYELTCTFCNATFFVGSDGGIETMGERHFCSTKCASEAGMRKCHACNNWGEPSVMLFADGSKKWMCNRCYPRYVKTCPHCYHSFLGVTVNGLFRPDDNNHRYPTQACPDCCDDVAKYGKKQKPDNADGFDKEGEAAQAPAPKRKRKL